MSVFIDLTGQRFGRLIVINRADDSTKDNRVQWHCLCHCGNHTIARSANLRKKQHTTSCGCYKRKQSHVKKHGLIAIPEYNSWAHMKARCYNKSSKSYYAWGGRGIRVCDRWLNSFENFIADIGRKPSESHSIDRIDNDGDYEPSNCRWATPTEQSRNQRMRITNTSGITGVSKRGGGWCARIHTNGKSVFLYQGPDFNDACRARAAGEEKYWSTA